jgi:hypothetical protein
MLKEKVKHLLERRKKIYALNQGYILHSFVILKILLFNTMNNNRREEKKKDSTYFHIISNDINRKGIIKH